MIDGDLCERFALLTHDKKQMIAGELDRSVREIERKISVSINLFYQCYSETGELIPG